VKARIVAAFAVVYLVWGSTYLGIRWAVETFPPFVLTASRFLVAGALLYALARLRGAEAPDRRAWIPATAIGTLLITGGNGLVVWAEQRVPSGLTALIVAGMPLWVALFERVAPGGKPLPIARVIGLLVGFGGLALLVTGPDAATGVCGRGLTACADGSSTVPLHYLIAVPFASISWALGSVGSRRVRLPTNQMLTSAMNMLAGGAVALVIAVVTGELRGFTPAQLSTGSLAAWAYLVVFGSMLAFTCFTWLVSVVEPTRVATYAYVNPVVALVLGAWLAHEPLGPRILVATPVILIGLALVLRSRPAAGASDGEAAVARRAEARPSDADQAADSAA
jgi:drug/metabolite transporter (DMT)-like permease